ncbi:ribosomal RNA processing protein 36 homolog [Vigna unguiculata]|uniref:ribosomal RNA processing protein 36 homolog n=1 Tax=Vigna unguiculata TaxID=3917 RepID=UPI0010163847|nr:ribosomal RNA processing protein 36 homolog [Vigna unguiculata]XP_027905943.1 ribosomal RNA processing protein 36 homolog [Vigna unguiculata]
METQYEKFETEDSIPDSSSEDVSRWRPVARSQFLLLERSSKLQRRFKKRYNFLYENDLPAERQGLKKQLKKYKDPKRISEIEERISWIDKQMKSDSTKNIDTEILANHKKKEREATKQGKRPFYLKKSEIRKQRPIEKYNQLKSSGKLEAFVEKRRRRNAAKDHRYMPYRRSGDAE